MHSLFIYGKVVKKWLIKKQNIKKVASKASEMLRDGPSSAKTKSIAGSTLSQTKTGKSKNK